MIATLKEALSQIGEDERGAYLHGPFQDFGADLLLLETKCKVPIKKIARLYTFISQDLWNISTISERLEWTRINAINNSEFRDRWRDYACVDIEHFHVEFRSIMDYSAVIIAEVHGLNGKLPESFRRLSGRIDRYENKLNPELVDLIRNAGWFWEVRSVRDSILHGGGSSMVFGDPEEGIHFQVHDIKLNRLIHNEALMYNENVVCFEKYMPYYFSHLINYLERLARICYECTEVISKKPKARSYSSGFNTIKSWGEKLLNECNKFA